MAEAALAAVAVKAAQMLVAALLKEIAKEVSTPLWKANENAKRLHRMVARLDSAVSHISPEQCDAVTEKWLQDLVNHLDAVKKVLKHNGKHGILKRYSTSKELAKEVRELTYLFQEMVLHFTSSASAEVSRSQQPFSTMINELLAEFQAWQMADVTRKAMETPTSNFGSHIGIISPNEAFLQIKDQADSCVTVGPSGLNSSADLHTKVITAPNQMLRRQNSMIFGGNQVVECGTKLLLDRNYESHWAGLWATGGAGKTLAAERIFNDSSIQAHFTGGCYWLNVGKDKEVRRLLCMLQDMLHQREPANRYYSDEELKNSIADKLRDRELVLLVLDDVWQEAKLLALDVLPRAASAGCRVLVTTRNKDILDAFHAQQMQVPLLSEEDSWKLFCWHACRGVSRMPVELRGMAKQITKECKGLPLALKVIGGAFSGKTDMKIRNWEGFWKLSLEKLKNADILSPEHEVRLYSRLKLSVDELDEVDSNLKECFLYFAAFPEDQKVDLASDLLPLWLGDRIVGTQSDYDPKEEAFRLLGWLISRSLVELHAERRVSTVNQDFMTCKVHDVLRDLARYMLQHKIPVEKRLCLYESGRVRKLLPDGWVPVSEDKSKMDATEIFARRLSIMSSGLEELPPRLVDAPNLQVMILRNNPINAIPDSFFSNLRNLSVLELRGCSLKSLPSSLKLLKNLLVLDLSNNWQLSRLPSSLGSLTKLEILNLDSCRKLSYVPSSLSSLTKLQYLYLQGCQMSLWPDAGRVGNWLYGRGTLKDLNYLVQLRELAIMSDSHTALPIGFEKAVTELQILKLMFTNLTTLPETLGDHLKHLKVLELRRCEALISLPSSLVSLENLETLNLSCCRDLLFLPPLDGLPSLVSLDLTQCISLQSLPNTFNVPGSFPALKELIMLGCTGIASFPDFQPGAMPRLEILDLIFWTQLNHFPKQLGNLTTLRRLNISGCPMQTLEQDSVGLDSLLDLEELIVKSCKKLSQLPASLASLPSLREISIEDCPANVPAELLHLVANDDRYR